MAWIVNGKEETMTVFEAVKQAVTTRQAAENYGIDVNRAGKAQCPFHKDRTPSMKLDKRFHCFGCGADGDVIDFTAKLYGLDAKSAAEKLAADFQISYTHHREQKTVKTSVSRIQKEQMYRDLEVRCFKVLSDYLHLLRHWEQVYAPNPEDNAWHPLFVEALQKKEHIEYLLDVLLYEPIEERAALIREYGKEVMKFEQRLSELGTGAEREFDNAGREPALSDLRGSQRASGGK